MTIENLSPLQRAICDHIWSCQTQSELREYFDSLPQSQVPVAVAMMHMIIADSFDREITDYDQCSQARLILGAF